MCHSDDHFSQGASFLKIPERFRDLTQGVPSIYDRDDLAGLKKRFQSSKIFSIVHIVRIDAQFLSPRL